MSFWAQFPSPVSWGRRWLFKVVLAFLLVGSLSIAFNHFLSLSRELDDLREAETDEAIWTVSQLEVDFQNFRLALHDAIHRAKTTGSQANLDSLRFAFDIYFSRTKIVGQIALVDSSRFEHILAARDRFADWIDSRNEASESELSDALAIADQDHSIVRSFALANLQAIVTASKALRENSRERHKFIFLASVDAAILLALSLVVAILAVGKVRRHSAALLRAATNLQQIIESSLDAVVVSDGSGEVLYFNGSARNLFHVGELSNSRTDFFHPLNTSQSVQTGVNMDTLLSPGWQMDGSRFRTKATGYDFHGRTFPVETSVARVSDFDGRRIYISFIRDIGDRNRLELELRQSRDRARQDASAKERFLAMMSHEMRTPLHGVVASLDLLRDTPPGPKADELLEVALGCSREALEQIDDVLEVTRIESAPEKLTPFDPSGAARAIVLNLEHLAHDRGNTIELDIEGPVWSLLMQRRSYRRVLYNLVGNAVKFTTNGVIRIRLKTAVFADGSVDLLTSVSDTGIGIAPENQKKIFEAFETVDENANRHGGSTGLGLSIVRKAVEAMGGEIGLSSVLGEGSTFWFVLRLEAVKAVDSFPLEVPRARSTLPKVLQILVVDDNQVNRILMMEMIKRLGMTATQAADGPAAIRLASEAAFDVILMDISMDGMDGIEATAQIRRAGRSKGARVIAVSAQLMPDADERLKQVGIQCFLSKPFNLNDLDLCLQKATSDSRPVIDTAQIDHIRSLLGQENAIRFAKETLAEAVTALRLLRASRNGADLQRLAETLHRSAGSAAMLGAHRFAEAMRDGERQARNGDSAGLKKTLEEALLAARATADIFPILFATDLHPPTGSAQRKA